VTKEQGGRDHGAEGREHGAGDVITEKRGVSTEQGRAERSRADSVDARAHVC
jgi:hypothetical protein